MVLKCMLGKADLVVDGALRLTLGRAWTKSRAESHWTHFRLPRDHLSAHDWDAGRNMDSQATLMNFGNEEFVIGKLEKSLFCYKVVKNLLELPAA